MDKVSQQLVHRLGAGQIGLNAMCIHPAGFTRRAVFVALLVCASSGCTSPAIETFWHGRTRPLPRYFAKEPVTISAVSVNGTRAPSGALEQAAALFQAALGKDVRLIEGGNVALDVDEHGSISFAQVASLVGEWEYESDDVTEILVFMVADLAAVRDDSIYGISVTVAGLSCGPLRPFIVIDAKEFNGLAAVMQLFTLSKRVAWRTVCFHELCHLLGVTPSGTHSTDGSHCVHAECILRPGAVSYLTYLRLRPPDRLCDACHDDLRRAQAVQIRGGDGDAGKPESLAYFDELVRLNPVWPFAYRERAYARLACGQNMAAANDLTFVVALGGQTASDYMLRAEIHVDAGSPERAIQIIRSGLRRYADHVGLANLLLKVDREDLDAIGNASSNVSVELACP